MYSAVKGIFDDYKAEKKKQIRDFCRGLVENVIEPRAVKAGYKKLNMADRIQEKTGRFYVPPLIDFESYFLSKNYGQSQENLFMMFRYKNVIDVLNEQLKESYAVLNFVVGPDFDVSAVDKVSALIFDPNHKVFYRDYFKFKAEFEQHKKSWNKGEEFVQKAIDELEKVKF